MKLTVNSHELHAALTHAASVTPTRSANLLAYTGVLLSVKGEELTISGSDGETTVAITLEVSGGSAGTALIPPKQVIKWLSHLPKDTEVSLHTQGSGKLDVSAASAPKPYSFHTMVATFPTPGTGVKADIEVDLTRLGTAVACVKDIATDIGQVSGPAVVQLSIEGGNVYVDATDRLRLVRVVLAGKVETELCAVVGLKALEIATKLRSTHIGLDKSGKTLVLQGPGHRVTVRTVDTPFPPVRNILESPANYSATVEKAKVEDALERLSCVAEADSPLIIDFDTNVMTLSAQSTTVGEGSEELELDTTSAAPTTLAVNINFLRNAVSVTPSDNLTFSWTSPVTPFFITSQGPVTLTTVIMPIRLNGS
jgi:DNA polymerase-3 subunit beta